MRAAPSCRAVRWGPVCHRPDCHRSDCAPFLWAPTTRRFIQPKGSEECRVYYSCVTKLRTWVPAPVYALLTKQALKQATAWVDAESVKEWTKRKDRQKGSINEWGAPSASMHTCTSLRI